MSLTQRPNYEIVLRYLRQVPGQRTITFEEDGGIELGMHNDQLCYIFQAEDAEHWLITNMSVNEFITLCNGLSETDVVGLLGAMALTDMNRKNRNESQR